MLQQLAIVVPHHGLKFCYALWGEGMREQFALASVFRSRAGSEYRLLAIEGRERAIEVAFQRSAVAAAVCVNGV